MTARWRTGSDCHCRTPYPRRSRSGLQRSTTRFFVCGQLARAVMSAPSTLHTQRQLADSTMTSTNASAARRSIQPCQGGIAYARSSGTQSCTARSSSQDPSMLPWPHGCRTSQHSSSRRCTARCLMISHSYASPCGHFGFRRHLTSSPIASLRQPSCRSCRSYSCRPRCPRCICAKKCAFQCRAPAQRRLDAAAHTCAPLAFALCVHESSTGTC